MGQGPVIADGLAALHHQASNTRFRCLLSQSLARARVGRGEEKRYLSLLFNPSINPLPPKGERGIYGGGQACIRTLERVALRAPIRPALRRPSA